MFVVRTRALVLLLCLLAAGSSADTGPLNSWTSGGLVVHFSGTGREAGVVLELSVDNTSKTTQVFQLPPLLVLEPGNKRYSPVLVEKGGAWELEPGAHFKVPVTGYGLDHSKDMPGASEKVDYRPSLGGPAYAKVQHALKESLSYEKRVGFKASILPGKTHRTLVIQRVLWLARGGNNPSTPQDLVKDLTQSFAAAGKSVSEAAVNGIAASVWSDVQKVYEALAKA